MASALILFYPLTITIWPWSKLASSSSNLPKKDQSSFPFNGSSIPLAPEIPNADSIIESESHFRKDRWVWVDNLLHWKWALTVNKQAHCELYSELSASSFSSTEEANKSRNLFYGQQSFWRLSHTAHNSKLRVGPFVPGKKTHRSVWSWLDTFLHSFCKKLFGQLSGKDTGFCLNSISSWDLFLGDYFQQ